MKKIIFNAISSIVSEIFKASKNKDLETYKVNLNNSSLVTKLQLKKEFDIHVKVFPQIYKLYVETQKILDPGNDPTKKDEIINKLNSIKPFYDKASSMIVENKPFYQKNIYDLLIKIRNSCKEEQIKIITSLYLKNSIADNQSSFLLSGKEKLKKDIDSLALMIRERTDQMKII